MQSFLRGQELEICFLWRMELQDKNTNYLNTHIGQVNLVSRGFADFMEFMLPSETVWKK